MTRREAVLMVISLLHAGPRDARMQGGSADGYIAAACVKCTHDA